MKLGERRFFTDSLTVLFNIFQDLAMHINVSSEQHTQSMKQLLKNISTKPESVKELGRWGLEISTQIMMVRLLLQFQIFQHTFHSFSWYSQNCFHPLQIRGRTLPIETICMQSSSFATSADVSWSREVVRDASISSVSTYLQKRLCISEMNVRNNCCIHTFYFVLRSH